MYYFLDLRKYIYLTLVYTVFKKHLAFEFLLFVFKLKRRDLFIRYAVHRIVFSPEKAYLPGVEHNVLQTNFAFESLLFILELKDKVRFIYPLGCAKHYVLATRKHVYQMLENDLRQNNMTLESP